MVPAVVPAPPCPRAGARAVVAGPWCPRHGATRPGSAAEVRAARVLAPAPPDAGPAPPGPRPAPGQGRPAPEQGKTGSGRAKRTGGGSEITTQDHAIEPCQSGGRSLRIGPMTFDPEDERPAAAGPGGEADLLDMHMVKKLDRRTRRVAMAPWLYHIGMVEFSRYAHKSRGREAARTFDLLRLRDLALAAGAYTLVPSEVLGVIGLITDALAMQRLTKSIPAESIASDRSIGAFPIASGWALEFNAHRVRAPIAALVPSAFHGVFAIRNKLPLTTAATVILREAISDGAATYVVAELSNRLRAAITQQFLATQGARRSSEIAADRRSRARLWLVGTHARLNALAASRWAVEKVKDQDGPAKFIEAITIEEKRLREMFESRIIPLGGILERINVLRGARDLQTVFYTDDLDGQALQEDADAAIEWLVEAVCPFAAGPLTVNVRILEAEALVALEADRLPSEVMPPFSFRSAGKRDRIEGRLVLAAGTPSA